MFKFDNNHLTMLFANGATVSLTAAPGTYSSASAVKNWYDTVEVAAWDGNGDWIKLSDNDEVAGWQNPDNLLEIMNKIAEM